MQYKAKDEYIRDPFNNYDPFGNNSEDGQNADMLNRRMHIFSAKNTEVQSLEEATRRAEGYLHWIGATKNDLTGAWSFDGDIECDEENFLIYEGQLTVWFDRVEGYFACDDMGLTCTSNLPNYCQELHIIHANLGRVNWLPDANVYNLRNCNITYIAHDIISEHCHTIDISHNPIESLPNLRKLGLSEFDCSYTKIQTLQGAPYADKFRAASCKIREITIDGSLLFDVPSEFMDLSNNDLISLKGIPPVKNIDLQHNHELHSFKGLEEACMLYPDNENYKDVFREINANDSGIQSLDYLPRAVFKLQLDGTSISNLSSNSCESIWTLYLHRCFNLESGDKTNKISIGDLYLDEKCSLIKSFATFRNQVHNISYPSLEDGLKMERDFFNSMNSSASGEETKKAFKYDNEEDYYDRFLGFIDNDERNWLPDDFYDAIKMFNFPESYHKKLENYLTSKAPIKRFNL
jgi:hypothetical protein